MRRDFVNWHVLAAEKQAARESAPRRLAEDARRRRVAREQQQERDAQALDRMRAHERKRWDADAAFAMIWPYIERDFWRRRGG